jgi:hypothetical protein
MEHGVLAKTFRKITESVLFKNSAMRLLERPPVVKPLDGPVIPPGMGFNSSKSKSKSKLSCDRQ